MPNDHDIAVARDVLERHLTRRVTATAAELRGLLGISQPTFSRLVRSLTSDLLVIGRSRSTRYAWHRPIRGVSSPIPVFEVGAPDRVSAKIADLFPIQPYGFWVERYDGGESSVFEDLPYFLHDLRPTGFLGRLIPRRFPDLGLPPDIRFWSADQTLFFLSHHGWNHVGALVIGQQAFQKYVQFAVEPPDLIPRHDRAHAYPTLAAGVLALGPAGSSAAGEQPKFLATRQDIGSQVPVLVKFSPPPNNAANRRIADLLVAEHLALQVLRDSGIPAAATELVVADGRTFLEVERFDRLGAQHRRGTLSLEALDAQFVNATHPDWSGAVQELVAEGIVRPPELRHTRWVQLFGELIANTDMHRGNLSFYTQGTRVTGLAPVYDMTPMAYAPRSGELVPIKFQPPRPGIEHASIAAECINAAMNFWTCLAEHPAIDFEFRAIAQRNQETVAGLLEHAALLPRGVDSP